MASRSVSLVSQGLSGSPFVARPTSCGGREPQARRHRARGPARTGAPCRSARASSSPRNLPRESAASPKSAVTGDRRRRPTISSRYGKRRTVCRLAPVVRVAARSRALPLSTNGPKPAMGWRSSTRSPGANGAAKRISSVSGSTARTPTRLARWRASTASDLAACRRSAERPSDRGQAGPQLHRIYKVAGRGGPRLGEPGLERVGAAVHAHERRARQPLDRQLDGIGRAGQRSAARQRGFDKRFVARLRPVRGRRSPGRVPPSPAGGRRT